MRRWTGSGARRVLVAALAVVTLLAVGSPSGAQVSRPEYVISDPAFEALEGATAFYGTQIVEGEQSGYRIEVPDDWNGDLVLYAHGLVSPADPDLVVQDPPLREHLITQGYAWAASSYRANGYVIDAGIEDTHALLEHWQARTEGSVADPDRVYFHGVSMGGHVTGAAIERRPMAYDGAYPLCGAMGDVELFDYFLDVAVAAGGLSGWSVHVDNPDAFLDRAAELVMAELGLGRVPEVPWQPGLTHVGRRYAEVVEMLSGGERPMFDEAFDFWVTADEATEQETTADITVGDLEVPFLLALWGGATTGGIDDPPGIDGVTSNAEQVYTFSSLLPLERENTLPPDAEPGVDGARHLSQEEAHLNVQAPSREADPDATLPFPAIEADLPVPVLTMHTIGDLFVPFLMQQVYAERAEETGTAGLLVQRAIRATGHCEFTEAELIEGFGDLVDWVENGNRPAGDTVRDAAVLADRGYGCAFTRETRPGVRPCDDLVSAQRIAGADRIATAVELSQKAWPDGAPMAFLARSDLPVDALAGSTLAGAFRAPILLTPRGRLEPRVQEELTRLGVQRVLLLGSEAALSRHVADAARNDPRGVGRAVGRVAGPNRYATAAAIAVQIDEVRPPVRQVLIVRGDIPADAFAVSAFAAFTGHPVLLATPNGLPRPTMRVAREELYYLSSATLIGSTEALGPRVVRQLRSLGITAGRLGGETRYGTSAAVVNWSRMAGMSGNQPLFATGEGAPDAAVAGPAAAELGEPLILVNGQTGPGRATLDALGHRSAIDTLSFVGGPPAIRPEVTQRLSEIVRRSRSDTL